MLATESECSSSESACRPAAWSCPRITGSDLKPPNPIMLAISTVTNKCSRLIRGPGFRWRRQHVEQVGEYQRQCDGDAHHQQRIAKPQAKHHEQHEQKECPQERHRPHDVAK